MKKNTPLSCYVMGETSLVISCAERLLAEGFTIKAVVSEVSEITAWAAKQGLPVISRLIGEMERVDYLFSIVNSRILPPAVLKLAKCCAINYHDALLPAYAGVNAMTWALIHNEKEHGISWHIMEAGIDTGNILAQEKVAIEPAETVLSLNLKCYQAALSAFEHLLVKLKQKEFQMLAQKLERRSYYGIGHPLPGCGFIDWREAGIDIERRQRALSFGDYPNAVGTLKCWLKDKAYLVFSLECIKELKGKPGEILSLSKQQIVIATAQGALSLNKIASLNGKALALEEIINVHHLEKGDILSLPPDAIIKDLSKVNRELMLREPYWVNVLANPMALSWLEQTDNWHQAPLKLQKKVELDVTGTSEWLAKQVPAEVVASLCLLYCYRLNQEEPYTLGLGDATLLSKYIGLEDFVELSPPVKVEVDTAGGLKECIESLLSKIAFHHKKGSYFYDIAVRYPALKEVSLPRENYLKEYAGGYQLKLNGEVSLCLAFHENKGILSLHSTDRLWEKEPSLRYLLDNVKHFIEQAMQAKPERAVASLPLLSQAEQQQLLIDWNQTEADYPKDQTIQQLFEAQAVKTPDNIALVFEGQQLTYKELNERANQLAHYLRGLGVKPDQLVAISLERSLELVIGILAILKAGGAYVPLDPSYPKERLTYMLEDTQASIMLTHSSLLAQYPHEASSLQCLAIDTLALQSVSTANPVAVNQPNDLAYVIYTSGSTGKPKGVMIEQGGLSARLTDLQQGYQVTENDRVLFASSPSFDAAIEEFILPLISGACTVIAKAGTEQDIESLIKVLNKQRITGFNTVPVLLQLMVNYLQSQHGNLNLALRYVTVGGDALPATLAVAFKQSSGAQLYNLYGPTENTIDSTCYVCGGHESGATVAIGKPLANSSVYVLDSQQQPAPIGVAGELYVGGVGVARGYLNRPELTQEKFIANPFATAQDKAQGKNLRLYRTGDLVRYLPDGNIEFLGRIDQQVKIRGFRIEPGEIESVIREQAAVADVAVIAREDNPGDKRLVAYVVFKTKGLSAEAQATLFDTLRLALKQQLPDYMVPAAFMGLAQLPLNASGKLDRKALPKPEGQYRAGEYVAPHAGLEQEIAAIWAEVLDIPLANISRHDNFFEQGGHSLSATRLRAKLRAAFTTDISLQALFQHPVLAEMTQAVMKSGAHQELALVAQPRPARIPLSFAQQRLWFLQQLLDNKTVYNIPLAFTLKGLLNHSALEQAWQALVARHESLRTVIKEEQGEGYQVILPATSISLPLLDLRNLKGETQANACQARLNAIAAYPFNLSEGPLWQLELIQLAEDRFVFALNLHHSIADGWSMGVLLTELSAYYQGYASGKVPSLSSLPVQYADYALWQREYLQGEVLQQQLAYWQSIYQTLPEALNLPTDKPRPAVMSYQGANYSTTLPAETFKGLQALSRETGSTLFMTLLAAYQVLLYRYTGQNDIVIGTPIAGRQQEALAGLIGFFVNTLALRGNLEGKESFIALLAKAKASVLQAHAHQDAPFDQLIEQLKVPRELNRSPLFQTMLVWQNADENKPLSLSGIAAEAVASELPVAKFDVTLSATPLSTGELALSFEYASDLFEAATIARMAEHFKVLLSGIVKQPEQVIAQLPLLSQAEQQQLLIDWNQTEADYPKDQTIQQLFEAQAVKTPDNIALVFEGQQLTYKALNERANQLAHYLRGLGVKPDQLVAISLERSLELVIGILAILKAGGAYVPLDPSYPKERLTYMLEDTQASIMLTHSNLLAQYLHEASSLQCLAIDTLALQSVSTANPVAVNQPNDLAYVIYTSGSTGKPKGVMIEHQGVVNLVATQGHKLGFTDKAKVGLITPISFDVSVKEWANALLCGATLYISAEQHLIGDSLGEFIQTHALSILAMTPSRLSTIKPKSCLKTIMIGGESASRELIHTWSNHVCLLNAYGPTETTICASFQRHNNAESNNAIGKPIANTLYYVLNKELAPVPIGVSGELYIGGVGVARGYLNRPELTAEKFIANPFATAQDKAQGKNLRLYRTGDLVRYLPDGNIEFLGRIDQQVKIRGFRIELGEIESVIREQAAVADAAVIAREDNPGDKRLVAYVVFKTKGLSAEAQATLFDTLRLALNQQLPDYMVPAAFMGLAQLPLNASGKLDRKALPKPEGQYRASERVAPRNYLEQQLVLIWADILGLPVEALGIQDNFFERGGHSLLLVPLVHRINSELKLNLKLLDVYQYPTIAELTQQQGLEQKPNEIKCLIPIRSCGHKPAIFCLPPGGGLGNCYLKLNTFLPGHPLYALNNPTFGKAEGFDSLSDMAASYLKVIREVQAQGPYYLLGWSLGGMVALEIAKQLEEQGLSVAEVIMLDSLNLQDAPPALAELEQGNEDALGEELGLQGTELAEFQKAFEQESTRLTQLLAKYKSPFYAGRVSLLRAQLAEPLPEAEGADEETKAWLQGISSDVLNHWHTLPALQVISIAGNHSKLFDADYLLSTAAGIEQALSLPTFDKALDVVTHNLFAAAARNDSFIVTGLLKQDPLLCKAVHPETGWNLLHFAAHHNNRMLADMLLESGVKRQTLTKDHQTAADIAQQSGYTELAYALKPIITKTLFTPTMIKADTLAESLLETENTVPVGSKEKKQKSVEAPGKLEKEDVFNAFEPS